MPVERERFYLNFVGSPEKELQVAAETERYQEEARRLREKMAVLERELQQAKVDFCLVICCLYMWVCLHVFLSFLSSFV